MAATSTTERPAIILLADDDPGDQELTRRALGYSNIDCELHVVSDGEEALNYLFQQDKYSDPDAYPLPDLFLLDLNMPRVTGQEVLQSLNEHPKFKRMAIVVLTTSRHPDDILNSYDLGVKSCIIKPLDFQQFIDTVQTLGDYWLKTVILPRQVEG